MTSTMQVAAALIAGTFALSARADEVVIKPDQVPARAMSAVKAKFAGAEITGAAKDVEDGKTTYEVMLTHKGGKYDVSVKEDGTIVGYEKAMKAEDLPKAVTSAVMKKYPKAKIKAAEELTTGDTTNFEVAVADGGKAFELVVDAKGKIVTDPNDTKKD